MRSRSVFVVVLGLFAASFPAQAESQLAVLSQKLVSAADPRARAQAAQSLAALPEPSATQALCAALSHDAEVPVRVAAARALGAQGSAEALACLKSVEAQPEAVRDEVASAVAQVKSRLSRKPVLYVSLAPVADRSGSLDERVLAAAERTLRERLAALGGVLASPEERPADAAKAMKAQHLEGYHLQVQLTPTDAGGLSLNLACFTYPERKLLGAVKLEAKGAEPETLVEALAPQAVEEAAATFRWKH